MNNSTPEAIKQSRIASGLTQKQCAELVGKSLSQWKKYESGMHPMDVPTQFMFSEKLKKQKGKIN